MTIERLEIKAAIQVQKSPNEVFEAIVNPERMSNYFISQGSGRMEDGKIVNWKFPEFDFEFPVRVDKTIPCQLISFFWEVNGKEMLVEIVLEAADEGDTIVRVSEKSMENDEAGINWLKGNTEGWANFLACLKAYLEYGINLRKGAFKFIRMG